MTATHTRLDARSTGSATDCLNVVSQCLTAALVVHFPRAPTVMWDGVSD